MPKDFSTAVDDAAPATRAAPGDLGAALLRKQRSADFSLFRTQALAFFGAPPEDARHERMAARAGFSVREAETEGARTVHVAYGARPVAHAADGAAASWRRETEAGAALVYRQGVDGVASAFLYPARSDSFGPEEDGFVLGRYQNLEVLTGRGVLEDHWALLRSYAEATSLDGEPSWLDHVRVGWLRFSRRAVRAGRVSPARAAHFVEVVGAFALSVGDAAIRRCCATGRRPRRPSPTDALSVAARSRR